MEFQLNVVCIVFSLEKDTEKILSPVLIYRVICFLKGKIVIQIKLFFFFF